MSNGSGSGGLGLTTLIGSIVAWCNTPSFVGLSGIGKSLLVGSGTSLGATIIGLPVALAAGAVIGGLGLLLKGKKAGGIGFIAGAILGGLSGGVYGAVEGYHFSKNALTEPCALTKKASKVSFNNAAEKTQTFASQKVITLKAPSHSFG